jgi:cytochrome c oxidase subunit 3
MGAVSTSEQNATMASRWAGGRSPFDVGWGKLMMWLFLMSDAATFTAMLVGLWTLRLGSPTWPDRAHIMNIQLVGIMTVILICSSTTMALSVYETRRGQRQRAVWFLGATIVAGLLFASLQATEWTHFIEEGARLNGNPWGVPAFSFTFFIITGYHGLHVVGGCLYLWVMAVRIAKRQSGFGGLEVAGLYWGFVDLVWVFIWPSIYLL